MSHTGPGESHHEGITLIQLIQKFPDDATAEAWFVDARWPEGIICPHSGSTNVNANAKHHSMPYGPIEADETFIGGQRKPMSHEKRNGIESFWSMLKRGYQAIFHKISPERLNRHVSEFAGRHSIRVLDTVDMMLRMVAGIVKRLRYLELIGW